MDVPAIQPPRKIAVADDDPLMCELLAFTLREEGLAMLRALRDAHWMRPVILMTAFADGEVRRSAERLGAELLEKPFTMQLLRDRVRAVLSASDDSGGTARR